MFILNNIHNRDYKQVYKDIHSKYNKILFDINDFQLKNKKNSDWLKIKPNDIVCVITSSRKISTICKVTSKEITTFNRGEKGFEHVLVGDVIAKLDPPQDMTTIFNKFNVKHEYLNDNKFSQGFNVADIGTFLDNLSVNSSKGVVKLGELKL
ncbi:MAG: hypothetical protein EOM41_10450 [Bacilli bacterium]|nr:hypothetical protein [Bacilli bacterium]